MQVLIREEMRSPQGGRERQADAPAWLRPRGRTAQVSLSKEAFATAAAGEVNAPPLGEAAEGGPAALPAYDHSGPCLIRKEPSPDAVTTYEATARALGLLERNVELGDTLLAPLRLMTAWQVSRRRRAPLEVVSLWPGPAAGHFHGRLRVRIACTAM
jgi:hypothetical protein